MSYSFEGKKVLVTGGSRGIGYTLVNELKKKGATVHYTSRTKSNLVHDKRLVHHEVDFLNDNEFDQLIEKIKLLKFDILVNNAGINLLNKIDKLSYLDYDNMFKINVKRAFELTTIISQALIERNAPGKIVNISSIFSVTSKESRVIYTSTKEAINGLTKGAAVDLSKMNILVNSVLPGFTKTELTDQNLSESEQKKLEKIIPIGRLANTIDIVNPIIFLISDFNTYITGQKIIVDGGFTIT